MLIDAEKQKSCTVEDVMSWGPCWTREQVVGAFKGRERMTAREVAEEVWIGDALWVFLNHRAVRHWMDDDGVEFLGRWFVEQVKDIEGENGARVIDAKEAVDRGSLWAASCDEMLAATDRGSTYLEVRTRQLARVLGVIEGGV